MPSKPKPRRQSQVLAGGTEICSSSGVQSGRGGKKVAKSSGVVGGGCACRKVALGSQCSRCGPTGFAGAFAHRAGGAVDRAAECGLRAVDANGMQ